MKELCVLCFAFILFSIPCFTQKNINLKTYNVDSILLILPEQVGEERVNSLNSLAISLCYEEFDLAEQYSGEAMRLANEYNYKEGIGAAYRNFGYINFFKSNYPEALNNFFESFHIYEELDRKHTSADIYYEIACTHYYANNDDKTVEYALISLNKFSERLESGETIGSARDTIKVLGQLYLTYTRMDDDYNKSFELLLRLREIMLLNNVGMTEMMVFDIEIGANYLLSGEIDSAKVYLDKALAYPEVNQDIKALKYMALVWKGYTHRSFEEYDSALYYHEIAYKWYNKTGVLFWALDLACALGIEHQAKNDLNKAEKYFKNAESIFNEMIQKKSWYRYDSLKNIVFWGLELYSPIPPGHKKRMTWGRGQWLYYMLYQINEEKNNTGEALKYYIAYSNAADTLNRLTRNHETVELQTKYESERKDQQIENLSKENEFKDIQISQSRIILFGLLGLVILIVVLAIVLIRQNKLREQQKNLLLQQRLFRSQMNPHFIFNSLARIQNFIVKQDSKKASIYFSRFSELLRNILDNSSREFIPFEKELGTIENYLDLQKIRYHDKFDYKIDVDEAIDTESIQIPPMLAQPFIENAIEHGIKHKDSKGHIQIRFSIQNNMIVFEVEDDGVGREKAQEILFTHNKDHQSMATSITRERIQMLNKKLKKKIALSIQDLKDENNKPNGTKVTFKIPAVFS
jgi:hypothetical protein